MVPIKIGVTQTWCYVQSVWRLGDIDAQYIYDDEELSVLSLCDV